MIEETESKGTLNAPPACTLAEDNKVGLADSRHHWHQPSCLREALGIRTPDHEFKLFI